jgi:hypothetical protein
MLSAYYRHVVKAEKSGERDIVFTFDGPGNRELPHIVGQLTVLPKHWWEGTDASGKKRDVTATTLEPPLGSGAYRVKEFVAGRTIALERVKDYWGKDLNVNVGRDNFDEVRYEYFRDSTVALEAFKGDALDWRTENSAKNWATAYDFPAVKDKRVVLEEFPIRSSGVMQAFIFNTRRDKFKDPRVREALGKCLRFRVDQQDHHVRRLCAHPLAVPELGPCGGRSSFARRVEAAGAVSWPGPRRSVRRALCTAGIRRFRTGPQSATQGTTIAAGGGISGQGQQAPVAER